MSDQLSSALIATPFRKYSSQEPTPALILLLLFFSANRVFPVLRGLAAES